jgi:coenzyme F420-0:L-glutamate ligase/coenzyme F420-1:gamma-L-glutamate ligase
MLTLTPLERFPYIQAGDDLVNVINNSLTTNKINILENDILVITQKIVSKSEGRFINLKSVTPSQEAMKLAGTCEKDGRLVELILQESKSVLRVRTGTIIVRHRLGFVCANAGIDHSNVFQENPESLESVLLLPEDPNLSARIIREKIKEISGVTIGILIIDSHGRAWRLGVVGFSIGISGIPGLIDMRGREDLFGGKLRITEIAVADELAAAASLMMGQASEGFPVIHVRGFPYPLRDGNLSELIRPIENDLFNT